MFCIVKLETGEIRQQFVHMADALHYMMDMSTEVYGIVFLA